MHIKMAELGLGEVLAGTLPGRKALGLLIEKIAKEPESPEIVYLDFTGVEVATASFLRECVFGFRDFTRRQLSNYYPIVANIADTVQEELAILLEQLGGALLTCSLDAKSQPTQSVLLGDLEPKQKETLDLVGKLGEADASSLMKRARNDEKEFVKTAWNNRLAALARLGLIVELRDGRSKRYRVLLGEI